MIIEGIVIVDGISLDYGSNEVTDPRGTLFLTMSTSAGSKFYNPIGEDQWFVQRSLDDRSQLFSKLTFSKNKFRLLTMDVDGNIVDSYTINKTEEQIKNPNRNKKKTDFSELEAYIRKIQDKKLVLDVDNVREYNYAIENAIEVLNDETANQQEVDSAIKVLNTRLSGVEFVKEENKENDKKDPEDGKETSDKDQEKDRKVTDKKDDEKVKNPNYKDDQKSEDKETSKKEEIKGQKVKAENFVKDSDFENKTFKKSSNVKTGVTSLSSILGLMSVALLGLFKSKRK